MLDGRWSANLCECVCFMVPKHFQHIETPSRRIPAKDPTEYDILSQFKIYLLSNGPRNVANSGQQL